MYALQRRRRSNEAEIGGALLAASLLRDIAWEAAEQLDLNDITSSTTPFAPILRMLDTLY